MEATPLANPAAMIKRLRLLSLGHDSAISVVYLQVWSDMSK